MTTSFTVSETSTFTVTHARYLASKIKTDLKRIQRLYGQPSNATIDAYETEATALLRAGYLETVTYGFQRDGKWIEPTLIFRASDVSGWAASDDDPGRVRPGAGVTGASFTSYLTYTPAWSALTTGDQQAFNEALPFQRTGANAPGVSGVVVPDLSYSAGGRTLSRSTIRSL